MFVRCACAHPHTNIKTKNTYEKTPHSLAQPSSRVSAATLHVDEAKARALFDASRAAMSVVLTDAKVQGEFVAHGLRAGESVASGLVALAQERGAHVIAIGVSGLG